MKKVYVVYQCDYCNCEGEETASCTNLAVFSTKEKAEKFAKEFDRDYSVGIDKLILDLPDDKWVLTCVKMSKEGEVIEVSKKPPLWFVTEGFDRYDLYDNMLYCLPTKDKEEVIRIANMKRGVILLYNAWGDGDKTRAALTRVGRRKAGGKDGN